MEPFSAFLLKHFNLNISGPEIDQVYMKKLPHNPCPEFLKQVTKLDTFSKFFTAFFSNLHNIKNSQDSKNKLKFCSVVNFQSFKFWREIYEELGCKIFKFLFNNNLLFYKYNNTYICLTSQTAYVSNFKLATNKSKVKRLSDSVILKQKLLYCYTFMNWPNKSVFNKTDVTPKDLVLDIFDKDENYARNSQITEDEEIMKSLGKLIRIQKKMNYRKTYDKFGFHTVTGEVNKNKVLEFIKHVITNYIPASLLGGHLYLHRLTNLMSRLMKRNINQATTLGEVVTTIYPGNNSCIVWRSHLLYWLIHNYLFKILTMFFYFNLSYQFELIGFTGRYWYNREERMTKSLIKHNKLTKYQGSVLQTDELQASRPRLESLSADQTVGVNSDTETGVESRFALEALGTLNKPDNLQTCAQSGLETEVFTTQSDSESTSTETEFESAFQSNDLKSMELRVQFEVDITETKVEPIETLDIDSTDIRSHSDAESVRSRVGCGNELESENRKVFGTSIETVGCIACKCKHGMARHSHPSCQYQPNALVSALPSQTLHKNVIVDNTIRFLPKSDGITCRLLVINRDRERKAMLKTCSAFIRQLTCMVKQRHGILTRSFHNKWRELVREIGGSPLYYLKADIQDAYGSIKHDILIDIIEREMDGIEGDLLEMTQFHFTNTKFKKTVCQFTKLPLVLSAGHVFQLPSLNYISKELVKSIILDYISNTKMRLRHRTGVYIMTQGLTQGGYLSGVLCDLYYTCMDTEYLLQYFHSDFLVRLVDDYIYISTSYGRAKRFVERMYGGFAKYNTVIRRSKCLTNIDCEDHWSVHFFGHMLDMRKCSVTPYVPYLLHRQISSTISFTKLNPDILMSRMGNTVSLKLMPIFLDSTYNSETVLISNIVFSSCLSALKFKSLSLIISKQYNLSDQYLAECVETAVKTLTYNCHKFCAELSYTCIRYIVVRCFILVLTRNSLKFTNKKPVTCCCLLTSQTTLQCSNYHKQCSSLSRQCCSLSRQCCSLSRQCCSLSRQCCSLSRQCCSSNIEFSDLTILSKNAY